MQRRLIEHRLYRATEMRYFHSSIAVDFILKNTIKVMDQSEWIKNDDEFDDQEDDAMEIDEDEDDCTQPRRRRHSL